MFRFVFILFSVTLMADIGIMDSLKTRAIGQGNERVTLDINNNNIDGKSDAVELNLPDRFDVKVSKWWITENGVKINNTLINKITSTPIVFHFNKNKFHFKSGKILYLSDERQKDYSSISAKGKFINGKLTGKIISKNWNYSNGTLHFYDKYTSSLTATIKSDGTLYIIDTNTIANECKSRFQTDEGWGSFKDCSGELLSGMHKIETDFKTHFILKLPINQSQSQQKFIDDPQQQIEEPTQEQPQPITIPKTNLSVNVFANNEVVDESQKKEINPCTDIDFKNDPELKKYCANKAYNDQLDADEAIEDKKIDDELKAQEAEDIRIEALEKEEAKKRAIAQEAQRKQREAWSDRQNQRDKIENQELANDMQKRKDKQEQKTKAQRKIYEAKMIVHQFVDKADDRKKYLDKIDELSNKDTNLEDAVKIKNDARKKHYDSSQLAHKKELEKQLKSAKYWDDMSKSTEFVRDSSLTINKVIAKFDPTGTGDKIVNTMEHIYDGIEGYEKDGIDGTIVKLVDKHTNDMGRFSKDRAQEYRDLHTKGLKLNKDEIYYDKDHNRLTTYKSGDRLYDKNDQEVTFSYMQRLRKTSISKLDETYNPQTKANKVINTIVEGVKEGDFNKVVGGGLDASDLYGEVKGGLSAKDGEE